MGVLFRSRRNRGKRRNIIPVLLYSLDKKKKIMNAKLNFWLKIARWAIDVLIGALSGGATAYMMM